MYQTETTLRRMLRVRYPAGRGRIVLRTELDWELDIAPVAVADEGETWTFELEARRPFLYFKPCILEGSERRWAVGANYLVLMTHQGARDVYPFFDGPLTGRISDVIEIESAILGRPHRLRAYLPPGYAENTLKRYPVVFMQDGKNLFFPDEAFGGAPWGVDRTLSLLDEMQAVDKTVIVGLHSGDRMNEYTKPGYEAYGRAVVGELVPQARRRLRLIEEGRATAVMGSSLGGVVSFYLAFEWPEVFGVGLCLSSTFSHRDDLVDRVLSEPKRSSKFYLDSGWPGDNYEVTLAMAMALAERGYVPGRDYVHFAFPLEGHSEAAWGGRLHLPLQLFWSRVGTSYRETLA